jgi:hypothetical protein
MLNYILIRIAIFVARAEIPVALAAGNIHFGEGQQILRSTDWTNFLAMLGSGVLTFLAGAEIDPVRCSPTCARARPSAARRFCCCSRCVAVRAIRSRLLGDTADRVSDHAHCSVLIVGQEAQAGRRIEDAD